MMDYSLVRVSPNAEPEKSFLVNDMDEARHFVDPLLMAKMPDFDPDGLDNGIIGLGGEITAELLKESYGMGIFPWFPFRSDEPAMWFCPMRRYVIFPERIHISHSMRNLINKKKYHITINRAFEEVIRHCSTVDDRYNDLCAWLGETIIENFLRLHKEGLAKSVEVWEGEKLVGGFYGYWLNNVFQGDSMFSLAPSASKFGLVSLCLDPYIEGEKIKLIDTQIETPHFKSLGAQYIPYKEFRRYLDAPKEDTDKKLRTN